MKKYLNASVFIIAIACIRPVLQRELWFDEALTLLNFVLPLDLGKIYFSYTIPNNQIVYSMMLKLWDMFYIGYTDITREKRSRENRLYLKQTNKTQNFRI